MKKETKYMRTGDKPRHTAAQLNMVRLIRSIPGEIEAAEALEAYERNVATRSLVFGTLLATVIALTITWVTGDYIQ